MSSVAVAPISGLPPPADATPVAPHHSRRILILAPTANDASLTAHFIARSGLEPHICRDPLDLRREISAGCGAVVLAEEVLHPSASQLLIAAFEAQPSWSDVPVILVCSRADRSRTPLRHLETLGPTATVALIERPFGPDTLISMLQASLRSRERQYQVRDLVAQLAANESRLRRILEQTVVGLAETDLSGRFTLANDRFCALAGRTPAEILDVTLIDLAHPDEVQVCERHLQSLVSGEVSSLIAEKRIVRPDGSVLSVHEHLSVVRNATGARCGITVATADITERTLHEQQLARARDDALAASRAKDEFLASLSHELRTPLNPVLLLASENAANEQIPPDVRTDFAIITRNVALEARLIDDLLDLTRITRGKLQLDLSVHSLSSILEDAIATIQSDLDARKLQLERRYAPRPMSVLVDAVRLQQVCWNILKNAVKFTPEGGRIIVETRQPPGRDVAVVSITDTGIGMTGPEISRVFKAFEQGDHASQPRSRHFGGLGLGLAISKMIVDLHGGTISAHSAGRDSGATFSIELPLHAGPPATTTKVAPRFTHSAPSRSTARRILLVEDHPPTRDALALLLRRRHFDITLAGSLAEALAALQQHTFELVVSDIGLPDGNGYDLMKMIQRTHPIKGIALTGFGMEQDIASSHAAGFAAHLVKPVRVELLDEALQTALGPS